MGGYIGIDHRHILVRRGNLATDPVAHMRVGRLQVALDIIGFHVENAALAVGQRNLDAIFFQPLELVLADRMDEALERLGIRKGGRVGIDQIGVRTRLAMGRHRPRHVVPDIIFAVRIGKGRHQFGMGTDHMIGFHEGFLGNFPVAW